MACTPVPSSQSRIYIPHPGTSLLPAYLFPELSFTTMASHTVASTSVKDKLFDFIIVGGGTSGLVVASRLTEDPNVHVLVVEAGGDHTDNPLVKTPGLSGELLGNKEYDWTLVSPPQVRRLLLASHRAATDRHHSQRSTTGVLVRVQALCWVVAPPSIT